MVHVFSNVASFGAPNVLYPPCSLKTTPTKDLCSAGLSYRIEQGLPFFKSFFSPWHGEIAIGYNDNNLGLIFLPQRKKALKDETPLAGGTS